MSLSDEQITQIRQRLKEGQYCLGVMGLRDGNDDVRDLLALVDQLRSERDEAQEAFQEMHRAACEESGKAEAAEAAVSSLRTALEPVFEAWHDLGVVVMNPTVLAEVEAALRLPQERTGGEEKAEGSQR